MTVGMPPCAPNMPVSRNRSPVRSRAPARSTERTTPTVLAGMARPISVPTAARPEARPRACHSKMAAAGDRRGQLA